MKEMKEKEEDLFKKYGCKPLQVVLPSHEEFRKLLADCAAPSSRQVSPKPSSSSSKVSSGSGSTSSTARSLRPRPSTSASSASLNSIYASVQPVPSTTTSASTSTGTNLDLHLKGKLVVPAGTEECLQLIETIVKDNNFPVESLPVIRDEDVRLQEAINELFPDDLQMDDCKMMNYDDLNDEQFGKLFDEMFGIGANIVNANKNYVEADVSELDHSSNKCNIKRKCLCGRTINISFE